MQVLFIIDSIDTLKAYKDSTVAMMYALSAKGHELFITEQKDLYINGQVFAKTQAIQVIDGANLEEHSWWQEVGSVQETNLADFDAVIMRKDPPFNMEYAYSCHLLAYAEKFGAKVFNTGIAMLTHPEKLSITEFSQFTSPTLVSKDMARIKAFHQQHGDVVVKPLDGMGGMGIFRLGAQEPNLSSILELLTKNGTETIMAQRYIPEIVKGDKRILVINGQAVPYCLARIPLAGETRGNLAAGGRGVAQPLSERDWEIANSLAPILRERGLFLVGLDVIGDYLTEVNVTSPTCFVEITQQTDFDVAAFFVEQLEQVLSK
ncbi:glutathione synthetase [Pelistega indica]|uniref:Glutathione synthetase n=1 Tax=Pelistega indica TaxID=1414851 RepID=V8FYD9_9BURK|nr:glutathione synthase [Pelistega indica]ETD69175.1 glutathione synthetase [Pelistega indica]